MSHRALAPPPPREREAAQRRTHPGSIRTRLVHHAGHVDFRGCGKFEMYANEEPNSCLLNGESIDLDYQAASGRITIDIPRSESLKGNLTVEF